MNAVLDSFVRPLRLALASTFALLLAIAPLDAHALEYELEATSTGDIPQPVDGGEQTACLVADIDGDGHLDLVIGERSEGPSVAILFRVDGKWERETIEHDALPIEAGGDVADIDGDGDLDVSFGGDWRSNRVWWWENPGARPYPASGWTRRLVKDDGALKHHDQIFGDFDDDGALELAFWNQDAGGILFLAEIPADVRNAGTWPRTAIFDGPDDSEGLDAADIDGDGLLDIVGAGYWFEHVGGTDFVAHTIVEDRAFTRTVAGQLVPGGRPEVVIVPGDASGRLAWYEWTGATWRETVLDDFVAHGHSLEIGDVNLDGDLDIFVAEMHTPGAGDAATARMFLGDGAGGFTERTIVTGIGFHESKLGDMDGDGVLDIVGKPFQTGAPGINCWIETGLTATDAPAMPAAGARLIRDVAPNPFNARTEITLELRRAGVLEVALYDVQGRRVRTLSDGGFAAGVHTLVWDGRDDVSREVASGTYFLRATGEGARDVRAITLVK